MRRYLVKRVGFAVVTVFLAVSLNFLLFRAAPGDAASNIAQVPFASDELRESLTREFGLDKSTWEQYVLYLRELGTGNLGVSFDNRRPVSENLTRAFGNTLKLVIPSLAIGLALGLLVGLLSAWRRDSWLDRVGTIGALAVYSMPSQWVGLMLIALFAGLLPTGGIQDDFLIDPTLWEQVVDYLRHVTLPAITLGLGIFGIFTIIVRSSLLETLGEDYVLAARAKGLSNWAVIRKHALPNAALPAVTLVALLSSSVLGATILVETVFSWPGMGQAMFEAVNTRDYPMLQGGFLLLTTCVVVANLIADLLYLRLDPRIRVST